MRLSSLGHCANTDLSVGRVTEDPQMLSTLREEHSTSDKAASAKAIVCSEGVQERSNSTKEWRHLRTINSRPSGEDLQAEQPARN